MLLELERWRLDQRMNDRGFLIDTQLAEGALEAVRLAQEDMRNETEDLTAGLLASTSQRDALLKHILECYGYDIGTMRADALKMLVDLEELPGPVRELLQIRLISSKTSTAKYKAVLRGVNRDRRLRGTMQFNGASRTGRNAGRVFQPLNLPRPEKRLKKFIDAFIEAVIEDPRLALMGYDIDLMPLSSAALRGLVIAPEGRQIMATDLSQIESRYLAWLAGEEWKLQAFRDYDAGIGPDVYIVTYSKAFKTAIDVVIADEKAGGNMRQVGKVQDLSLGFGGGPNAFGTMAKIYGVRMPDEERLVVVRAYRKSVPNIVKLWYGCEEAARSAIGNPGVVYDAPNGRLAFERWRGWLWMHMPSGRRLCYPSPKVDEEGGISYMGVDQYKREWSRLRTYGGKLVENATQAGARDGFWENIPHVEELAYDPLFTVYDELVTEADPSICSPEHLEREFTRPIKWAPGLPIASKAFAANRYRKD